MKCADQEPIADAFAALLARSAANATFTSGDLLPALGIPSVSKTAAIVVDTPLFSVRLLRTREFGMVLEAGLGGNDRQLGATNFSRDRATVSVSTALTDADDFLRCFRATLPYLRLRLNATADSLTSIDTELRALFGRLLAAADAPLASLELDPVALAPGLPVLGANAIACPSPVIRLPRPIAKIDQLLHPKTMGIVGVSASGMNFGRIILHNIIDSGYPREQICIIRPGETEIDGVRCVENLSAYKGRIDLLVVAVPSDAVYGLVDEIIDSDTVDAVILIPGSLGETQKSREPAAALEEKINRAHARSGGGPVFLGANCLGVVSHPGNYDSWFIPLERLPKPSKKPVRDSVLLSQSGAFMITRLSQNPWLDPRYMMALGNQTDLTHGDLLSHFAGQPEINTIGVYIEGFRDGDGLDFARAVRSATLNHKQVVIYKSGRTPAGAAGVMGHTASVAGDADVFSSVLRQAGAIVVDDFLDFDDMFYIASCLHSKRVGPRLGAISGAGFEAVGMADAAWTPGSMLDIGTLNAATVARVQAILVAKKLDTLVEVRNPIDINPGADDEAHLAIAEAFAADSGIDAVVVGLDPTAPSVRALAESRKRPGFDINDPKSTVNLMPPLAARLDKPLIGIVDGGRLYDAMAAGLMDRGVCVFRNCARGVRALNHYVEARKLADALRSRYSP